MSKQYSGDCVEHHASCARENLKRVLLRCELSKIDVKDLVDCWPMCRRYSEWNSTIVLLQRDFSRSLEYCQWWNTWIKFADRAILRQVSLFFYPQSAGEREPLTQSKPSPLAVHDSRKRDVRWSNVRSRHSYR